MACNLVVEKNKFKINKRQVYVANTHKKKYYVKKYVIGKYSGRSVQFKA